MINTYDLLEMEQLVSEREKAKCETDLNFFLKKAWHCIEPAIDYTTNWHIDAICEHLQAVTDGEIKRLLINMPPRNLKSVTATVMYPCWTWINNPYKRFISVSYSDSLSKRHNMDRRHIIQSPWYQNNWQDNFILKDDMNTQRKFGNDHEGFMMSTSINGTLTGDGGDIIILDDPHNPKKAESDAERQQALDFFTQTLPSRLNDKKSGAIIVIMQRLHEEDISGHILSKDLGYTHLNLPAVAEEKTIITFPKTGREVVREVGDVLNPAREDKEELEQLKKDMGSYAFSGQYQQTPTPSGGGMAKKWWWRYWKPKGVSLPPVRVKNEDGKYIEIEAIEIPEKFDDMMQSWDMAFKAKKDNDFVGCGIWKKKGADKFLVDLLKERLDFTQSVAAVRNMKKKYPNIRKIVIEDKANGPAVITTLKHEITGIIPYNPGSDSKEARAAACTPQIEAGNVYLPHPALYEWVDEYIDIWAKFPLVKHDEEVDITSQALNYWESKPLPAWMQT